MERRTPTGQLDFPCLRHRIPGTSGATEPPIDFQLRLACLLLLARLPNEALGEAAESLRTMWEYYRDPAVAVPSLPAPPPQAAALGREYVRPTFSLCED